MVNHFVDSNVFLSVSLQDNDKKCSVKYFETEYFKFTSSTVKTETKRTIYKIKNINVVVLDFIENYISTNNIPDDIIGVSLKSIKSAFLKKYSKEKFPFGFTQKNFIKSLINYF